MTRLPPNAVSTSTIPGGVGLDLADLDRPLAPGHRAQRRERGLGAARARRRRRACPRSRRTSGRCRAARRRPRPRAAPGRRASRTTIATPEARASSFSTEATPPRVASRRQRRSARRRPSSASTAGHSERVSDSTSASSSNSPRASMIAVPCSPIEPETRIAVAGPQARRRERRARVDLRRSRSCRGTSSRRGRARRPSCRRRRSRRPPRPRRAAIASTSARSSSAERPSSSTIDRLSASGRAPAIARSLTVPLTASSPIEPPGKRIGLTTKLSVVNASSTPPTSTVAGVGQRRERGGRRTRARAGPRSASASPCRRRRGPS